MAVNATMISYGRIKAATGLSDEELRAKERDFKEKFPNGLITYKEFKEISKDIIPGLFLQLHLYICNCTRVGDFFYSYSVMFFIQL